MRIPQFTHSKPMRNQAQQIERTLFPTQRKMVDGGIIMENEGLVCRDGNTIIVEKCKFPEKTRNNRKQISIPNNNKNTSIKKYIQARINRIKGVFFKH